MQRQALLAALLALMIAAGPAAFGAGANLQPFDSESPAKIRAAHAGKAFVLAFWSTQCEPCREEMAQWRDLKRKYPALPVILVATDPPAESKAIQRFLARYNPGSVQTWAYADEYAERVRYAVDPGWRGELPRTYFYDAVHRPVAKSGLIDPAWIENWIATHASSR